MSPWEKWGGLRTAPVGRKCYAVFGCDWFTTLAIAVVAVVVPMIARIVDLHNALGLFQKPAQPKTA